jgi:hypothetical protein
MPEDKKIARMLYLGIHIVITQLLHNNFLSFKQLKCGDSHMTYLARNTVKSIKILYKIYIKSSKRL